MAGMLPTNRGFNAISKRAEANAADTLRDTFVDSGVMSALESRDHQVLYGRRGTGKTHALRYLQSQKRDDGDVSIYVDLRTIGSADSLLVSDTQQTLESTRRLLVDLLEAINGDLLGVAVDDAELAASQRVNDALAGLQGSMSMVRIENVESTLESENSSRTSMAGKASAGVTPISIKAEMEASVETACGDGSRRVTRTVSTPTLRFSGVARALAEVAAAFAPRRIWIILDEWSSLPAAVQPKLAEFVKRCILPTSGIVVKIGAIEQQTHFREEVGSSVIGIEVGADVSANISLDDFMVFELDQDKARDFFRGLMFRHLNHSMKDIGLEPPGSENDMISAGFTDTRAFDELVRAGEGVPRDAINIAAQAAMQAGSTKISVPRVRLAARSWYQTDKEGALRSRDRTLRLLNWVIDKVIRGKNTRGFLVNQRAANAPVLLALFDSRVLHLVKRGYSAQDQTGERFDVYLIDYGAYVDLMQTKVAPAGNFLTGVKGDIPVEVPPQDLRAIRRAVLDVDEFDRDDGHADEDRPAASVASEDTDRSLGERSEPS